MLRACLVSLVLSTSVVSAMEPVSVETVRFSDAGLTIVTKAGDQQYTPARLETLGTYAMTTHTPWREQPAEFVGVRLSDLLEKHGLSGVSALRVVAENDYAVTITREIWVNHDLLVATRVDGRPHSRRARGPIQFVFNMASDPSTGEKAFQQNWVWMAARIEPVH